MAGLIRIAQAGAALAVCFAAPAHAQPAQTTSPFYVTEIDQYHGVSVSPWPGERMLRDRSGGRLWVQATPILTGQDVATVSVGFNRATRRHSLRIRLNRKGAGALEFYIDGHVDFRGAVVLDGKVLGAPVLDGKMEDSGEIDFDGDFGANAKQIATRIQQIADGERAGRR